MQSPSAPTPISRQVHQEQLIPVEPAPSSRAESKVDSSGLYASGRTISYSQAEQRQRRAEIERDLASIPTGSSSTSGSAASSSGANLAQSILDEALFDMVRKDEAPSKPEGLWGPGHPANEHQATPVSTRAPWFWSRSSPSLSARDKAE